MNQQHKEFRDSVKKIYQALVLVFGAVSLVACFLVYGMIDPGFSAFRQNNSVVDYTVVDEDENWDKMRNLTYQKIEFNKKDGKIFDGSEKKNFLEI